MRSVASCLLIFTFVFAQGLPASAQKIASEKKSAEPVSKSRLVKIDDRSQFGTIEAYTEGHGAWVRWRMESERDNAGFYIYRSAKGGELLVSDLIPGSSFKVGDQPEYNQEYVFFDPAGSIYSIYTIESQSMKGTRVRSSAVAAAYTHDISEIKGGDDLIAVAKSKGQNTIQLNNDLLLSNELRTEVTSGLVAADIDKHREVIAQPGARIAAKSTGIVRVTKAQLLAAGFDANADPTNWQLYLDGVERPIIVGPGSDYIEFLGKKLDTLESDLRMYYLIVGSGPGKRMATTFFRPTFSTVKSRKYPEKIAFAERTFYVNQILNGDLENYWGRVIASGLTSPVNLNLTAIDRAPGTRAMTVDIQGFSPTFHSVEVTLNGVVLGNIEGSGSQAFSGEFQVPVELLIDGVNALRMRSIGAAGDISLFNRVSIDLSRGYVAVNDRLDFPTENYRTTTLSGFSSPNVRLFDVTFEDQPKLVNNVQMVQTNGTWGPYIPAHRGRVYYAAGETSFGSPISVTSNDPEVLRSPTQSGTLLIISHGSLMAQAQNWANYRSSQGTITKVVNVEEIYDEFNYGSLSSFAVEDFLNYAKNNWQTPPSYVLLIGDASVDPRNYTNQGYWDMVPTRQVNTLFNETASDEAVADFNDDGLAEIAIGRISSRTGVGITTILNKTIAWESSLTPTSMDRGALFAYDQPDGYDFQAMSNRIMAELPAGMPKTTVQRGTPDNATAQATIINALNEIDGVTPQNSGQYIVNYTGHGTSAAWWGTGFFSSSNVPQLTNSSNPSLFTSLTCLNAYFAAAESVESFAETLTKAPNGGAVAIWASTGKTTPDVQEIMAARFFQQIALGNITRMGDLIADAKDQIGGGSDVRSSWVLLGDPMLKVR